jgi:hypothetical protein
VEAAANNELPTAGARAKAIGGIYKEFREHLNEHASHSSYSHYSLSHLLKPNFMKFKKMQRAAPAVLERNIRDFTIQMYLLVHEAAMGLEPFALQELEAIAPYAGAIQGRIIGAFNLNTAKD